MPYKGSKNAIAEWVVDNLPKADCFVDLFCGGCAVTHRALLSGKYKRFIANDIDGRLPKLFLDSAHGKYTTATHTEWISRETFNAKKDKEAWIALCWSFGNNGKDYLYSREIEPYKHAYHEAVFFNNLEPLKVLGVEMQRSNGTTPRERYNEYRRSIREWYSKIRELHELLSLEAWQSFEVLRNLERLENLERLQNLEALQNDYSSIIVPDNSVIYCDPPYSGTNCGKYSGFNSERFYEWAREQDNIYISEYNMPNDFIVIAERKKIILSTANGSSGKAVERIYTNRRTYERMGADGKRSVMLETAVQLSLF